MKQPNTHHLRRFIDRTSVAQQGQSQSFTYRELSDISMALNDLMLYQRELEQENQALKEQIRTAADLTVEMKGSGF
jgi:K+/H+ antiporter YhaU regulatory subunit KhtT